VTIGRARAGALAIGFAGGLTSGLLGVGGGIVMVPGLVLVAGLTQRRAHATSLAAIVPIGAVGATLFALDGEVNWFLAALLAAGSVIGAPLGVRALARLPETALRILFASTMLAIGARLLLG
jgi:hypothetical protein